MNDNKKGINSKSNPNFKKRITDESLTSKQRYNNNSFDLQFKKLDQQFFKGVYTMKQVSIKLDIDRANICRFIAKRKKSNRIYLVRFGICPITKHTGVGFYTTNYDLYFNLKNSNHGK